MKQAQWIAERFRKPEPIKIEEPEPTPVEDENETDEKTEVANG
jgi:hypothetical protein